MNIRAVILSTAVLFGFIVVIVRLGDLMLFDHEALAARAKNQHQTERAVLAKRGGIFDKRGSAFAVNIEVQSAYLNPRQITSPSESAKAIAGVSKISYRAALGKTTSKKGFVWLERKLPSERAAKLKALHIKGLGFKREVMRYYPKGRQAAHVVGFVGIDNQPLEGLEYMYHSTLEGRGGKVKVTRDASGATLSEGLEFHSGGSSLRLTIDEGLQYIVENAVDEAMEVWEAQSVSAVMMNPFTGEIMAMANRPTYDLNAPGGAPASARRNRALTDTYEPGSTFKIVAASAALNEGLVKPDMMFDTSRGFIDVGGMVIRDVHSDGEPMSFRKIIQASSNVGTVMVGQLLGPEKFYEYARSFGFGTKTGLDLPGEAPGRLRQPSEWSGTSLGALSIGYEVAVTPLQVLRAYSAIANGGYLVRPHLVSEVFSPEGDLLYRFRPGRQSRVITAETARTLREILVSVTNVGGTAQGASVDGNRVAGKTGTTRLIDPETGKYSTEKYVSSFVGFVPADRPKVAIIVVVHEPKGQIYGGIVAAPFFKDIASKSLAYLNIPREDTFYNNMLIVRTGGLN